MELELFRWLRPALLAAVLALGGCAAGSSLPSTRTAPSDGAVHHTVSKGETVYAISRRYGVPVRAVIAANRLRPPYTIHVGQRVKVPAPSVHVVARGDTVYSIAQRYGVDTAALSRVNEIGPPYTIHVGQRLRIPGADGVQTASANGSAGVSASPPSTPSSTPAPLPPPPPGTGRFAWPVTGQIVSTYGAKDGGLRNDGINIAAPRGTHVRAAENGTVAYAGTGIQGFGNLLLIKHADGYMTAYGHNETLLVERGQTVRRGEVIARVGSSGSVGAPQLHFEIRKGKRAIDPLAHLGPPQTARAWAAPSG